MIGPRLLERLIEQEHEQEDVLDVFEGILIFIGPVLQRGANETQQICHRLAGPRTEVPHRIFELVY